MLSRFLSLLVLVGCGRSQSSLNIAGEDADAIGELFWVMLAGACVLWLLLNGAFFGSVALTSERRVGRRYRSPITQPLGTDWR
ncbi:hypothetical protein [Tritonibacter mobilis]|uniref:hypothetical protein n=1 Tax=Tritonibacter mobilis TaxID=379347 RepID=UPI00399023D8